MSSYYEDIDADDTPSIVKREVIQTKGMKNISFLTYIIAVVILILLFSIGVIRIKRRIKNDDSHKSGILLTFFYKNSIMNII